MQNEKDIYYRKTNDYTFQMAKGKENIDLTLTYHNNQQVYELNMRYNDFTDVMKFVFNDIEEVYEALLIQRNHRVQSSGKIQLRAQLMKNGQTVQKWVGLSLHKQQKKVVVEEKKENKVQVKVEVEEETPSKIEKIDKSEQPVIQKQEKPIEPIVIKSKITFIGPSGSGKTCLVQCLAGYPFKPTEKTVGIDFIAKNVMIDNKTFRLQFWDTAGQERFLSLIPSYLKDSKYVLVCFDLSSQEDCQTLPKWISLAKDNCSQDCKIIIMGTKLENALGQVSDYGKNMADKEDLGYLEVSAKDKIGINAFLNEITISALAAPSL